MWIPVPTSLIRFPALPSQQKSAAAEVLEEILKTIACFRFILPRQEIMIAGGPATVSNLRDAQTA